MDFEKAPYNFFSQSVGMHAPLKDRKKRLALHISKQHGTFLHQVLEGKRKRI